MSYYQPQLSISNVQINSRITTSPVIVKMEALYAILCAYNTSVLTQSKTNTHYKRKTQIIEQIQSQ